jgi:hypothetical protein
VIVEGKRNSILQSGGARRLSRHNAWAAPQRSPGRESLNPIALSGSGFSRRRPGRTVRRPARWPRPARSACQRPRH